jgi:DNA-binding YbaB/EbfC family protein
MFDDLMKKMQEAQQNVEKSKEKLEHIMVDAEAGGNMIKVSANGNRRIKNISIDEDFLKQVDKEELEDLLLVALNRVLESADSVNEAEMQAAASQMMPPGFGM